MPSKTQPPNWFKYREQVDSRLRLETAPASCLVASHWTLKSASGTVESAPSPACARIRASLFVFPAAREGLPAGLAKLDRFAQDAEFLLGHNIIDFDLPLLKPESTEKMSIAAG